MHIKPHALLFLIGILLISTLACTFSVNSPSEIPTVIVQPVNTQTIPSPTVIPSEIPSAIPANTLAPTSIPPTQVPSTQVSNSCSANWFFSFDAKHQSLGSFCPEPVKALAAIGEDFEGGRVYRYAPDPAYPADQRGTIYVIYNDGEWVTFPDNWDATQPSNDPTIMPPANRYQPVDAIGKVWREVPEVRNRLGWALESQSAFQGRFQSYAVVTNGASGDSHYYFIDHGKWGLVLLLNSVDMGPNTWEVAGKYQ
jgi:hypothetical protein